MDSVESIFAVRFHGYFPEYMCVQELRHPDRALEVHRQNLCVSRPLHVHCTKDVSTVQYNTVE